MKNKKQNQRIIPVTPHWQSFFELAKQITKEQIATDGGQAVVIEMLEYGQRLDKQTVRGGAGHTNVLPTCLPHEPPLDYHSTATCNGDVTVM